MGKFRRGGYLFYKWRADHKPRHVHVFVDKKFICKWDLENGRILKGRINRRILDAIFELEKEKRL